MSRYPDSDIDIDEGDDDPPYDDPAVRTQMAWLRTLLIVSVIGLLLWRAAYVDGQQWWSLGWLLPSLVIVAVGVMRIRQLAHDGVGERRMAPLAWALASFLAAAGVGMILAAA